MAVRGTKQPMPIGIGGVGRVDEIGWEGLRVPLHTATRVHQGQHRAWGQGKGIGGQHGIQFM